MGWKSFMFVFFKDGVVLVVYFVLCVLVFFVIFGDFSNDGLMDFVVCCEKRCDFD